MPATSWTGPAGAEMVPRFRSLAAAFAAANGVPTPPLEEIKLAVSEAVTNAVLHAYCERMPCCTPIASDRNLGR